uniref:Uncharacterized protein n=1 Tax=Oryza sativa subsp. japonica TaxID=39947 RepID=Q6Z0B1_ORYSJ|nr:hypothetical protein [Oryza sativa Japonica Group]BAD05673.1 hypothetical protein [Oryza sativa Japonica Group]
METDVARRYRQRRSGLCLQKSKGLRLAQQIHERSSVMEVSGLRRGHPWWRVDGQGYKEENIAGYGSSFLLLMKIMMLVIQSDFSVDEVQTHEANNFVDNSWPKMKVMPIANVPVVMFMIINC